MRIHYLWLLSKPKIFLVQTRVTLLCIFSVLCKICSQVWHFGVLFELSTPLLSCIHYPKYTCGCGGGELRKKETLKIISFWHKVCTIRCQQRGAYGNLKLGFIVSYHIKSFSPGLKASGIYSEYCTRGMQISPFPKAGNWYWLISLSSFRGSCNKVSQFTIF